MTAAGGGYTIDASTLARRLRSMYSHWREHRDDLWGSCNAFAVATPPPSDDIRYLKSSALNIWLLGYEFPETIMVFSDKQIHFLCSQKKASLLDVVKKPAKDAAGVDVLMHVKQKTDDGLKQMDTILHAIESLDSPVLGHVAREAPEGKLLEKWTEKLRSSGLQLSDITNGLADLFAVKEASELLNVRNAAYLTASAMKLFAVPKLEQVIEVQKKVTHSSLMDDTEKAILEPIKLKVKLKADNVDICYPPIFQSGGNFDLRPSASSNDNHLSYDAGVIICALGSRYNSYCANVARTILIDSNATQSKAYQVLLKAHEAAIGALKPNNKASDVYKAALAVVEKEAPELTANLTKSAGTGIGLEFRESGLSLNEKNERILKVGMVLNVSLGFRNLQTNSSKTKSPNYALLLSDTVILTVAGNEVVTSLSPKAFEDVAYSFNDADLEGEDERPQVRAERKVNKTSYSKATLRSDNNEMSKEQLRRQHQAELARQKNEETAQRFAGGKSATGDGKSSPRTSNDIIAYKNVEDVLPTSKLVIKVNLRNKSILIPMYGGMVPFHIATVKKALFQAVGPNCYIQIEFDLRASQDPKSLKNRTEVFLKKASFRSNDSRHGYEVVQQINKLRNFVASREAERAERASLVTQEKLVEKSKPIILTQLWIRPTFPGRGRKIQGTLEAHDNGFRYLIKAHNKGSRYSTSTSGESVEILFANIKHAFFQAAEKEMITLLHFHLDNHIMVGGKKTKDVQFYVEVMDAVQTLGGAKRSTYDPDEIEEEQRERDYKNMINMDFQNFVKRVNDLPKFKAFDLEFDLPLRELRFEGVHHNASAFIVPTSSCLVELIETPFLVVTLSEIEIVNLERASLGQKSFDMAIVFKDFKREVRRICLIPSTSLDGIKEWLDTTDIKYYESRLNMNWGAILKTITDDPQNFIEGGGWEFLNMEGSDSDSDASQESDQAYEPSDVEPESDSEDDGSDSASLVESDNEEEEEDDKGSDESSDADIEDEEASDADREHGAESDSKEEWKRRTIKACGKSRADPSSSAPKRPKLRR